MANTTTSLNYERAVLLIQKIQGHIKNIEQHTSVWVGAFEQAQEKSSKQVWMAETVNIGSGVTKQSNETIQMLDELLVALRKYKEQLDEFSGTGTGLDV